MKTLLLLLLCGLAAVVHAKDIFAEGKYTADWKSLDSRTNPTWYDEAKVGIRVTWGVFSVPSHACKSAAEDYWYNWRTNLAGCDGTFHNDTYGPQFSYGEFGPMFTAQLFNPDYWAQLFQKSGAKYVVMTTKNADGWCNFPSPQSWNWNSVDAGPHKDLTGALAASVSAQGLRLGLYHSLFEWFNQLYLKDVKNGTSSRYVDEVLMPQMHQIVKTYEPSLIYADGEETKTDTYWKSKEFLAWLYNDSPSKDDVIVNDRWGSGDRDVHGGFFTGKVPDTIAQHKWEDSISLDLNSYGYNRASSATDYITIENLINRVVGAVAKNGNVLINVGPTYDGLILPIFQQRLEQLGQWMAVSGESIYSSRPWDYASDNDTEVTTWYTKVNDIVYVNFAPWPQSGVLKLSAPVASDNVGAKLLGYPGERLVVDKTPWEAGIIVHLPVDVINVKTQWMYTVKLIGIDAS